MNFGTSVQPKISLLGLPGQGQQYGSVLPFQCNTAFGSVPEVDYGLVLLILQDEERSHISSTRTTLETTGELTSF
jgi:hypothetical protein